MRLCYTVPYSTQRAKPQVAQQSAQPDTFGAGLIGSVNDLFVTDADAPGHVEHGTVFGNAVQDGGGEVRVNFHLIRDSLLSIYPGPFPNSAAHRQRNQENYRGIFRRKSEVLAWESTGIRCFRRPRALLFICVPAGDSLGSVSVDRLTPLCCGSGGNIRGPARRGFAEILSLTVQCTGIGYWRRTNDRPMQRNTFG